jgi:DNA modification methylase
MIDLQCGDCLELLHTVEDGSVALVLTDLPYGQTQNRWDRPLPLDTLWDMFRRILRPDGVVALFCMEPFTSELVMSNRGWWRYNWCWYNNQSSGHLNSHKRPLRVVEQVAIFAPAEPRYYPQMQPGSAYIKKRGATPSDNYGRHHVILTDNPGLRWPIDLLYCPVEHLPGAPNPTRKPLSLCRYLIRTYTRPRDLVLDTCMGTGTTGKAACDEQRSYVGMELDPAQFAFAADRIGARSRLDGR